MLNITIKQMLYIDAAGRFGSIAQAAKELGISESSISTAIDRLEQRLDFDVFVRTPAKGILATPAGSMALVTIHEFLEQLKHFENDLLSIGGNEGGRLRIACFVTAAGSFFAPIMTEFRYLHPNVDIEFLEGNMEEVVDLLDQGLADVAFTYSDVVSSTHTFETLISTPPFALVAENSELAHKPFVRLAELTQLPMVALDLNWTKGYYARLVTDAGLPVKVAHKTQSIEMVRALVSNGFGFSILNAKPSEYIEGHSKYCAVPIKDELPIRQFGVLRQSGIREPKIVKSFVNLCLELKNSGTFEDIAVRLP